MKALLASVALVAAFGVTAFAAEAPVSPPAKPGQDAMLPQEQLQTALQGHSFKAEGSGAIAGSIITLDASGKVIVKPASGAEQNGTYRIVNGQLCQTIAEKEACYTVSKTPTGLQLWSPAGERQESLAPLTSN